MIERYRFAHGKKFFDGGRGEAFHRICGAVVDFHLSGIFLNLRRERLRTAESFQFIFSTGASNGFRQSPVTFEGSSGSRSMSPA